MEVNNNSHYGQNNNISYLNYININVIQITGGFQIPLTIGRLMFHITGTMIRFLKMKGNFGGLAHKDHHEYLRKFMELCEPFVFKNIYRNSIRLKLFSFSLTGESTRRLEE